MQTICDFLMYDHQRCDQLFVQAETSVAQREWQQAEAHFQLFLSAFTRHVKMEESILFPAFEESIRHAAGPIEMLRMEHRRITGIVERIHDALLRRELADFILHAETFTILTQQHSMKEEEMLYPLLDRILAGNTHHIVSAMRNAVEHRTHSAM